MIQGVWTRVAPIERGEPTEDGQAPADPPALTNEERLSKKKALGMLINGVVARYTTPCVKVGS